MTEPMTPERPALVRVLQDAVWPFLAHDPANPDLFWGQMARKVEEHYAAEVDRLRADNARAMECFDRDQKAIADLQAERGRLRAQVAALTSALERTEANFRAAVRGLPVRDMAENLAENRAALASGGDS